MSSIEKNAIVTLAKNNDDLIRSIVLYLSFQRFNDYNKNDFIIMVESKTIDQEFYLFLSNKYHQKIIFKEVKTLTTHLNYVVNHPRFENIKEEGYFTFFNIFKLVEYSKILYIDCNSIFLGDCQKILECQSPAGIFNSPYKAKEFEHKQIIPKDHIVKSLISESGNVCKSTMILLSPKVGDFEKIDYILKKHSGYLVYIECLSNPIETLLCDFYLQHSILWTNLDSNCTIIPKKSIINTIFNSNFTPITIYYDYPDKIPVNNQIDIWPDLDPWHVFYNRYITENNQQIEPFVIPVNRCFLCPESSDHCFMFGIFPFGHNIPDIKNFCEIKCPKYKNFFNID